MANKFIDIFKTNPEVHSIYPSEIICLIYNFGWIFFFCSLELIFFHATTLSRAMVVLRKKIEVTQNVTFYIVITKEVPIQN